MALFGTKKNSAKQPAKKEKKEEDVLNMVKEPAAQTPAAVAAPLKLDTGLAHRILKNHHLSEKTNQFSQSGRYVFKVAKSANKIAVKHAVESVYDVHVLAVNMINVPGKNRRQGRVTGRTQEWKKAMVTLKDGERISGLAEGV
jgi:large subunit ribosomal protein L23